MPDTGVHMSEPAVLPAAPAAVTATAPTELTPVAPATATEPVDLAAEVEKWKALAHKHEKRAKENTDAGRQAELLQKVAEQLGLTEAAADPVAIAKKLADTEAESLSRAREIAVLRAAQGLGADGDALLDSRGFLAQIADVDPGDLAAVKAAVAAAVAAAPAKYGKTTAPTALVEPTRQASTAGTFDGAPGGNRQWTMDDVKRAKPAAVTKAMHDGLLTSLGIPKPS
jgi:hypothetical protein